MAPPWLHVPLAASQKSTTHLFPKHPFIRQFPEKHHVTQLRL
ncbi:rCG31184, partial [Rattus norvegicus]